jgi:anti-repressor protein
VAKDICEILDLGTTSKAIERLDNDEKGVNSIPTLGGLQTLSVVSESGLYSLTLGSKKPEAKPFKRWITHEVIPTIRKTGGYVSNDEAFINTYLPFADEQIKALFRVTLETVRQQNAKIECDKPKVLFADAVETSKNSILIGELAKLIRQNGVEVGQKRLFEWLRKNGYLQMRGESYNIPSQYSMERSLMEIKERTINNPDGSIIVTKTPKITGKGQTYFVNKFLTEKAV